jgi:ABC-type cobalamin/Fe3+-siderophores transport system ATPase subunit
MDAELLNQIKEELRNIYSEVLGISRQDDFDYSVEQHLEIISLHKKAIGLIKDKADYKILQWNLEETYKKQLKELNYKDLSEEERMSAFKSALLHFEQDFLGWL